MATKRNWFYRRGFLSALLILLGISSYCIAQDTPVTIRNFSAGLIDKLDKAEIPDGAAQSLQNVDVWSGKIEKRRGSLKQNSSAIGGASVKTKLILDYIDNDGDEFMIFDVDGTIYTSQNGATSFTVLVDSFGFTSASIYDATVAFGLARLTDGTTHWITFDGTSVLQDTVSVQGKLAEFYEERVWTADVIGDRSTLFASRFQDVTDWTANDTDDGETLATPIKKEDGNPIRALHVFKDSLLVFKDTSLFTVQAFGDGLTFVVIPVSLTVGTQYKETIQTTDKGVIFLHNEGYYVYNGVSLQKISDPIHNTFYSINQLNRGEDLWLVTTGPEFSSGTLTVGLSTSVTAGDVTYTTATILENFDDGDFTNSPTWNLKADTINGIAPDTEVIVSGHYFTAYTGGASTISYISVATTAFNATIGSWSFDVRFDGSPSDGGTGDDIHGLGVLLSSALPGGAGLPNPTTTLSWGNNLTFSTAAIGVQFIASHWTLWTRVTGPGTTRQEVIVPSIDIFDGIFHTVIIAVSNNDGDQFGDIAVSVDDTTYLSCSDCIRISAPFGMIGIQAASDPSQNVLHRVDNIEFISHNELYQSEPHDMSVSATNWSTFEEDSTLSGATIVFSVYSDTDTEIDIANSLSFTSSQTISNAQIPTIVFAQYVTITSSFARTVGFQTANLHSFQQSWLTGAGTLLPVSTEYQGDYFCSVAIDSTTVNDTMLVWDRNGSWSIYKNLIAGSMLKWKFKPYYGSGTGDSNIYRFQVDSERNDDGQSINSIWRGKEFDFGFPVTNKTIMRYYITAIRTVDSEATFDYFVNRSTTSAGETLDLDEDLDIFIGEIKPTDLRFKKGLSHSFQFSNNIVDDYFKILTISIIPRLETSP